MESLGQGTQFLRESSVAGTFERVAKVANIQPPSEEREVVEVEDLDPPGGVKQKLAGLIDVGDVSITLNFSPDDEGHTALKADFDAGETKEYQIKLPTGYGWTVKGFLSGWSPQEIGVSDVIQVEVVLTVIEKPTFGEIAGGI